MFLARRCDSLCHQFFFLLCGAKSWPTVYCSTFHHLVFFLFQNSMMFPVRQPMVVLLESRNLTGILLEPRINALSIDSCSCPIQFYCYLWYHILLGLFSYSHVVQLPICLVSGVSSMRLQDSFFTFCIALLFLGAEYPVCPVLFKYLSLYHFKRVKCMLKCFFVW